MAILRRAQSGVSLTQVAALSRCLGLQESAVSPDMDHGAWLAIRARGSTEGHSGALEMGAFYELLAVDRQQRALECGPVRGPVEQVAI